MEKIFGIGLSRTGIGILAAALRILGYTATQRLVEQVRRVRRCGGASRLETGEK